MCGNYKASVGLCASVNNCLSYCGPALNCLCTRTAGRCSSWPRWPWVLYWKWMEGCNGHKVHPESSQVFERVSSPIIEPIAWYNTHTNPMHLENSPVCTWWVWSYWPNNRNGNLQNVHSLVSPSCLGVKVGDVASLSQSYKETNSYSHWTLKATTNQPNVLLCLVFALSVSKVWREGHEGRTLLLHTDAAAMSPWDIACLQLDIYQEMCFCAEQHCGKGPMRCYAN